MSEAGTGGYRRTWIDHTSEIDAPAGEIYDVLADVDNWPSWTPGLTAIKRRAKGPWAPGQKFTMYLKPAPFHPPLPVPCETYEVGPRRLLWGGGIPGSIVRHSFELEPIGEQRTRVRQLEFATNLIALIAIVAQPGIYKHDLRMQNALRDKFAGK